MEVYSKNFLYRGQEVSAKDIPTALEKCKALEAQPASIPFLARARMAFQDMEHPFIQKSWHTATGIYTGRTNTGTEVVVVHHGPEHYLLNPEHSKETCQQRGWETKRLGVPVPREIFTQYLTEEGREDELGRKIVFVEQLEHIMMKGINQYSLVSQIRAHPFVRVFLGLEEDEREQYLDCHEGMYGLKIGVYYDPKDLQENRIIGRLAFFGVEGAHLSGAFPLTTNARFFAIQETRSYEKQCLDRRTCLDYARAFVLEDRWPEFQEGLRTRFL